MQIDIQHTYDDTGRATTLLVSGDKRMEINGHSVDLSAVRVKEFMKLLGIDVNVRYKLVN